MNHLCLFAAKSSLHFPCLSPLYEFTSHKFILFPAIKIDSYVVQLNLLLLCNGFHLHLYALTMLSGFIFVIGGESKA
jgi:hypothetical protein